MRLDLAVAPGAWSLAHALAHNPEHGQRGRLQQPAQASRPRDETRCEQRRESGHKKSRPFT